jgi:2-polyprenyl-6-hydroxyphenyl methylase/3-demethylubiquinone-9 3-methyltransferase
MGKFEKEYFSKAYAEGYERRVSRGRINYYLDMVREVKTGGDLLDVGCAYGLFMAEAQKHFRAQGCDVSQHAVDEAKRHLSAADIQHTDVFGIEGSERFDVVTCFDVLEHIESPGTAMACIRELLRPGAAAGCSGDRPSGEADSG